MEISFGHINSFINQNDCKELKEKANVFYDNIKVDKYSAWMNLPFSKRVDEINGIANKIKKDSDILVVVGIGGSYLGAKAGLEFCCKGRSFDKVLFLGNNLDPQYYENVLKQLENKRFSINVVSKSGATLEPLVAFHILEQLLIEKYGDSAKDRIYITTEKMSNPLYQQTKDKGYHLIEMENNLVGRYSVLSVVGLLAFAFVGMDISAILEGAKTVNRDDVIRYSACRKALYRMGKRIEIFVTYENSLTYFSEWCKQLFGESEGKDSKGIFPSSVMFTTDLHSLGQYIQEGEKMFFETTISAQHQGKVILPKIEGHLAPLSGKSISEINNEAMKSTIDAHTEGGVPNIHISIEKRDEFHLGQLFYFFQTSCVIGSGLMGVNPYDNEGVNVYKKKMFDLLGI